MQITYTRIHCQNPLPSLSGRLSDLERLECELYPLPVAIQFLECNVISSLGYQRRDYYLNIKSIERAAHTTQFTFDVTYYVIFTSGQSLHETGPQPHQPTEPSNHLCRFWLFGLFMAVVPLKDALHFIRPFNIYFAHKLHSSTCYANIYSLLSMRTTRLWMYPPSTIDTKPLFS